MELGVEGWQRRTHLKGAVPGRGQSNRGRLGMKEEEVAKLGELASLPEELGLLCFVSAVLRSLLALLGLRPVRGAIGR